MAGFWRLCSLLTLLLCLHSCAWWQKQAPESSSAIWHHVPQATAQVYAHFPEIPASHIRLQYQHTALPDFEGLQITQLEIYIPQAALQDAAYRQNLAARAQELFRQWEHPQVDCLHVSIAEYPHAFVGLAMDLLSVRFDTACG